MKNKFVLVLLLTSLLSCQDISDAEKPDNLIPEDKMVNVLTELALINAAKSYNLNQLQDQSFQPSKFLYAKFGIDSVQFARSNQYYTSRIDDYKQIFEKVKTNLEVKKQEVDSLLLIERNKQDSIRKVKGYYTDTDNDSTIIKKRKPVVIQKALPLRGIDAE